MAYTALTTSVPDIIKLREYRTGGMTERTVGITHA
jgi:hypothetical protein